MPWSSSFSHGCAEFHAALCDHRRADGTPFVDSLGGHTAFPQTHMQGAVDLGAQAPHPPPAEHSRGSAVPSGWVSSSSAPRALSAVLTVGSESSAVHFPGRSVQFGVNDTTSSLAVNSQEIPNSGS